MLDEHDLGFTSRNFGWDLNSGHVRSFPSLCWVRAEGRGLEPPNVQRDKAATSRPMVGPVELAPTPTPQSKPVTHASRLVAHDRTVGGIRALGRES